MNPVLALYVSRFLPTLRAGPREVGRQIAHELIDQVPGLTRDDINHVIAAAREAIRELEQRNG